MARAVSEHFHVSIDWLYGSEDQRFKEISKQSVSSHDLYACPAGMQALLFDTTLIDDHPRGAQQGIRFRACLKPGTSENELSKNGQTNHYELGQQEPACELVIRSQDEKSLYNLIVSMRSKPIEIQSLCVEMCRAFLDSLSNGQ